jgi:hypothetical protein
MKHLKHLKQTLATCTFKRKHCSDEWPVRLHHPPALIHSCCPDRRRIEPTIVATGSEGGSEMGSGWKVWTGQRRVPVPGTLPRRSCASRAGAVLCARAGAASGVSPIPTPELRPGVAGRRRGRGSPGVAAWIRARARAGDAATPEQEGEGGSEAVAWATRVRAEWGHGSTEERRGVCVTGAKMPRWEKGTGRMSGCGNKPREASVRPDILIVSLSPQLC